MRPGLSTQVMTAFLAMDWGSIEERVTALYSTTDLILAIPSREVTTEWLQRYLGMKEIYGSVTVWVTSEMRPQGHKAEVIILDDYADIAKRWDITQVIQCREEPQPIKYTVDRHRGVPQSKGDRHANRRYRWC